MKKIFLLLALFATVFVACSDDDDDEKDKPAGKEKLVSKIVTSNSKGIKEIEETFEYDSQKRITKYKYYNVDEAYSYMQEYTYGDKKITMKDYEDDELYNTITYTLENGVIVASSDDYNGKPVKFLYNSDKYLVKAEKEGYSEILTWSNGNLLKIGDDMSFTYTEYENKSNIDITSINFTEDAEFNDILFRSGYFGNRNKKLLLTTKSQWHTRLCQYEYTFDKDGYVTQISEIKSGETQTITYKE